MSKDYLPIHVDPIRFADNATKLRGVLPVKKMDRITSSLLSDEGNITADLVFGVDEQGVRFVKGHVEAALVLGCQRCMQPFICEIMSDFTYGIVKNDKEMLSLSKTYEPLMVKDDTLKLSDMIEEEVIINMPIVPMHDAKDCNVRLPFVVADDPQVSNSEKENPFKVIELLKVKSKQ